MVGVRSSALSPAMARDNDDGLMDHSASADCDSPNCQRLCLGEVLAAPRGWGLAPTPSAPSRAKRLVCDTTRSTARSMSSRIRVTSEEMRLRCYGCRPETACPGEHTGESATFVPHESSVSTSYSIIVSLPSSRMRQNDGTGVPVNLLHGGMAV